MRPIGPGIRTRRKRWFLAVAGSRTGHPLWGEVHGGMILAVFTCRGRPAAPNRATLPRHGSLWDGSSLMGTFRRAALRRTALALLSVTGGYCVTPSRFRSLFPCSWALRRAGGTRVPRPQLMATPSPRSGSPCVAGESVAPADILKWPSWCQTAIRRRRPASGNRRRQSHPVLEPHAWRSRQDLPSPHQEFSPGLRSRG
jgi:hypothetical protein